MCRCHCTGTECVLWCGSGRMHQMHRRAGVGRHGPRVRALTSRGSVCHAATMQHRRCCHCGIRHGPPAVLSCSHAAGQGKQARPCTWQIGTKHGKHAYRSLSFQLVHGFAHQHYDAAAAAPSGDACITQIIASRPGRHAAMQHSTAQHSTAQQHISWPGAFRVALYHTA